MTVYDITWFIAAFPLIKVTIRLEAMTADDAYTAAEKRFIAAFGFAPERNYRIVTARADEDW